MAFRLYRMPIIVEMRGTRRFVRTQIGVGKTRGLAQYPKIVSNPAGDPIGDDAIVLVEGSDFSGVDPRHTLVADLGNVSRLAANAAHETHFQSDLAKHRAVGMLV